VDADEPTTASEMELLFELRQLLDAAGATLDQEMTDEINSDLLALVISLHSVLDRAERVLELRRAKGYAGFSPEGTELLQRLYDRGRALATILEEL
jgi:hypothetical protein